MHIAACCSLGRPCFYSAVLICIRPNVTMSAVQTAQLRLYRQAMHARSGKCMSAQTDKSTPTQLLGQEGEDIQIPTSGLGQEGKMSLNVIVSSPFISLRLSSASLSHSDERMETAAQIPAAEQTDRNRETL